MISFSCLRLSKTEENVAQLCGVTLVTAQRRHNQSQGVPRSRDIMPEKNAYITVLVHFPAPPQKKKLHTVICKLYCVQNTIKLSVSGVSKEIYYNCNAVVSGVVGCVSLIKIIAQ